MVNACGENHGELLQFFLDQRIVRKSLFLAEFLQDRPIDRPLRVLVPHVLYNYGSYLACRLDVNLLLGQCGEDPSVQALADLT